MHSKPNQIMDELKKLQKENTLLKESIIRYRKEAAALEREKSLLIAMLSQMPVGLMIADAKAGRVCFANQEAEKIYGHLTVPFHENELRAFDLDGTTPIDPENRPLYRSMVKGEAVFDMDMIFLKHDGTRLTHRVNSTPVRDEEGRIIAGVATFQDSPGSGHEKMRRLHLSAIIENTPDMISYADADRNVLYINRAGREALGLSPDEPVHQNISKGHPDWANKLLEETAIPTAIKEGFWMGETAVLTRGGTEIPVSQVILSHKDSAGKVRFLSTIVRDMTRRKQLEDDLKKAEDELEERVREQTKALDLSNKELQEFAFVSSHDLQEPLRKIRTFGDMLADRCRDSLDETSLDYLTRMQTAAIRMHTLLNSLLAYSRLTTQTEPMKETDLKDSVEAALANLKPMIREKNAFVEVGSLPTVQADRVQMVRLFQNLIENALKFQREGETPHVKINAQEPVDKNGVYEILVTDNGIGFNEKFIDKIFLPFQRLHGRSQYKGTGMGLALCKKIAERHGAEITAVSEQGKGSAFIVTFPAK